MISAILCHHKGTLLRGALISLQASKEVELQIIVATSDEESVSIWEKEFPRVRFLIIKGGPAYKRNVASRFALGKYLAFFDDDIEVNPYALFYMKKTLIDKNAGCVFGKLLNMEFKKRFDEAGSFLTWSGFLWARAESGIEDQGQFDEESMILSGKSAAMLLERSLFWEVGGYDASYEILGEETDLAWRIWLAGYKIYYSPKSVTYHAFNTRFKPADFYIPRRVYFNGCRNYLAMLYSNLGKKRWIPILLTQMLVWTGAGIGMLITGKHEAGINIFKGLGYFILNMRKIWFKRYKVQKQLRKVPDSALLPIIMKNPPLSYYINRFFHYIKTGLHG